MNYLSGTTIRLQMKLRRTGGGSVKRNMKQIITEFLKTEPYFISAMSNISAVIMDQVSDLNWAGFYQVRDGQLVVGPFQGKPACIHIARGMGTCLDRDETIVVPDVHKFPGHIACDSASNSEIVIPIHRDGEVAAVLDIDSPVLDRFSEDDRAVLEGVVEAMEKKLEW